MCTEKKTCGHSEEVAIYEPWRENLEQTNLEVPSSWASISNCDKINFCCVNRPVCSILLWQPEQTASIPLTYVYFPS